MKLSDVKVMLVKGASGDTIESIEKTNTVGDVDTYTINLTDGSKQTFTVTNGRNGTNISNINKTNTSGLVDTYTVTLTDGSTTNFNVTNGNGIESIEKTGTIGQVDTYTITLTNGNTATFTVTNATGSVTVDSALSTTSTNPVQNKVITLAINEINDDLLQVNNRVASAISGASNVQKQIVPTVNIQNDEIATKRYIKGSYMMYEGKLYKVTSTIQQGGTITVGTNVEETDLTSELTSRAQVYHTGSFYWHEGSLNQWESAVFDVLDPSAILSFLGSGWYFGGASVSTDHDFILTGCKITETSIRVTIMNAYGSAQSRINVDVDAWFYHPASTN